MNYWIFVHKANNTFLQLKEKGNWGFKKRINELQKGDIVIFYVGGPNGKYLSGEATLTSNAHPPTREPVDGIKNNCMVDFDNLNSWNGQQILVKDPCVRQKLGFIKNKDTRAWGQTFRRSLIKITESDYKDIKALLE